MLIDFHYLFRKYAIKADGVLHLGANTGQEAKAYNDVGIKKVLWVEALPELMPKLIRNIGPYPEQIAVRACLSDVDGQQVAFHVASNGAQSSSFLELGTHAVKHPEVRYEREVGLTTRRIDTLLPALGIKLTGTRWFLNADLQGAELKAIKGMGALMRNVAYAYIEVNEEELYKGCPLVGEIDEYLAQWGLVGREVKMTNAGWGDKFYMRP